MKLVPPVSLDDKVALRRYLQKLASKLGPGASPTFAELTLTGLTASTLVGANASKLLESVTIGTGLDYTRPTLSLSHLGIEALTDPDADRIMFWDDSETASKWLGMGNSIAITTTTIDTIQDIRTTANPTFAGLILTNAAIIGSDSVVFQPTTDSTTFFQVKEASGTRFPISVDTSNIRVGFGTTATFLPQYDVHVWKNVNNEAVQFTIESTDNSDAVFNFINRDYAGTITLDGATGGFGYSMSTAGSFNFDTDSGTNKLMVSRIGDSGQTLAMWTDDTSSYLESIQDENTIGFGNMIFRADDDGTADGFFAFQGKSATEYMRILGITGFMGLSEVAPETLLELTHATPYITLHNSTHEDTDGGGESRLIFKREDGAGTETACTQIEGSHDGIVANNQLGKMQLSVNTGAGLVQALEIGSDLLATFAGAVSITGAISAGTYSGLVIGTDVQAWDAGLDSLAALTYVSDSFIKVTAENTYAIRTIAETKTDLSLNLVENTALSTWAGTANITTLGTITTVGNITITEDGTIGIAADPLLTFDGTNTVLHLSGKFYCETTGYPVFEAKKLAGAGADVPYTSFVLHSAKTVDMGDGFGSIFYFKLSDDTVSNYTIARLQAYRSGADNSGVLQFGSGVDGADIFLTGLANGNVGIGVVTPYTQLTVEGTLTLKEQAAADADTAAYGQVWCKTATPNQLWFVNDVGTEVRIAPQDLQITASPQFVKIGLGISPNNRVHIQTITTEGMAGLFINQVDDDQPFIEYYGNSAADTTRPITSLTAGNSIQGFVRTHINGTDYWMPYYDAPTS